MKILHIINSLATGGAEKLIIETLPLYAKQGLKIDLLLLNGAAHPFLEELASKKCCEIFNLGTSSVYNPITIFKIIPYLKKYDIVHVHLFPAQYWVVLAKLLSFSKTKLIFTEHNTTNRRLENPIFRFIDKWIYQFYAGVIAITAEIKTLLLKHTALSEVRFTVIENGVHGKCQFLQVQYVVRVGVSSARLGYIFFHFVFVLGSYSSSSILIR